MLTKFLEPIIELAKKQGIAFLILLAASYFFFTNWYERVQDDKNNWKIAQEELKSIQREWEETNNKKIEDLEKAIQECNTQTRILLETRLEANTRALEMYERNHK